MRYLVGSALMIVISANAVHAQQVQGLCGTRTEMLERLKGSFNEQPAGIEALGRGPAVELLMSESGSWSVLLHQPDGTSCIVDRGDPGDRRQPPPIGRQRY